MSPRTELSLAIPTYRSGDIAQTVSRYADNFRRYGHDVPIAVFDDSKSGDARISEGSLRMVSKRFDGKQQIRYVGPHEKAEFVERLTDRLGSDNNSTLKRIFRPSYGGNRNYVVAFTLGQQFISVDDDMRPDGLFIDSENSYASNTISSGRFLYEREVSGIDLAPQDVISGYRSFLGTYVRDHNKSVQMGKSVIDPNVDELGFTIGDLDQSIHSLSPGQVPRYARIKAVLSHLTGDADIDSADLVKIFMQTGIEDILAGHLPKKHILEYCSEAIVAENDRLTGAILGYDNTDGGIYFLPTTFRCEDFIWRMHLSRRDELAAAYTSQAQTHTRSLSVRGSIASDWYNELVAQVVKEKMTDCIDEVGEHTMTFHHPDPVSIEAARSIRQTLVEKRDQAIEKAVNAKGLRGNYLRFAGELDTILRDDVKNTEYFASQLTRKIGQEFDLYNRTAALWPDILTECSRMDLPVVDITREAGKN